MMRALAVALLLVSGCKKAAPPPEAASGEDEVRPVYGSARASALAQSLCAALHDLPAERRAQCCHGQKGTVFTGECVRVLSAALEGGGLRLEAAQVDACVAARTGALSACGWVGPGEPPLPSACTGLTRGTRKSGEVCRSSLECRDGERCLGVGPTDAGRCGPPRAAGQTCLTAVDPLAGYLLEDPDLRHPECAGFCGHHKCMPTAEKGAKCHMSRECPAGQHCDGESCVEGAAAAAGEKCVEGACGGGLRCVAGHCRQPAEEGAACKTDAECLGGCVPATHVCGMRCDVR